MTDRLNLPRRYREQLEVLLSKHVPGVEVWAYGSRVNGESHEGSDLDLALRGPALEALDGGFYDLLEAIEQSNIPILVQAHDWAMLPESFHGEIERAYVVVQERVGKQTAAGEWREVTLGEVLTLQRGFDLPTTQRKPGRYPVIASTGPVGTHCEAMVRGPGVVIGRSGSLGGGQFVEHDFWPLNTTLWVKDFKGNDPRFCYYLLKSIDLAQFNVGSGVPTLNRNHIHPFPVALPPLHEQRAIAHVLGTLDDKIELNRRMNETLEEMARTLFKSWFVDFEPIRAKMEGRWRRGESLPGLPAEHYDLFPNRLVPSELGDIPEDWEVKPLKELCTLRAGSGFPKARQGKKTGKYPFMKVRDMNLAGNSVGILEATNWVDDDDLEQLKANPFPRETTVFAKIGEGLKQNRIRMLTRSTLIDNNMMAAVPNADVVAPVMLYCVLSRFDFGEIATGTALPYLTAGSLNSLLVAVPPLEQQVGLSNPLRFLYATLIANEIESRTLIALRDTLLPRTVSGEVRVHAIR